MSTDVELVMRLHRLGSARNRDIDHEMREVTLTDDEALQLVELLRATGEYAAEGW